MQKAGTFVVKVLEAYHYGFKLGLNVTETVNYADMTWIEIGCPRAKVLNS